MRLSSSIVYVVAVAAVLGLSLLVVVAHAQAKSKDQQKNQNQTLAKEVPEVGVCVVGIKSACNGTIWSPTITTTTDTDTNTESNGSNIERETLQRAKRVVDRHEAINISGLYGSIGIDSK